jgi:hypothetical protein
MTINVKRIVLLNEVSTNSTGEAFQWRGTGPGSLQVSGTWDGATVTIQGSLDGGDTWVTVAGGVFTADAILGFEMGNGLVHAVVSSVGTTSLSAYLTPQVVN